MSKVGAADRSRLLRLKRAELSGIVKSRKRKLREIFAVCENASPIPQFDISNPDAPPINPAEAHFLDVTDILQDRLFNESNLPARRPVSQELFKKQSLLKNSLDARATDASRKGARSQHKEQKEKKYPNTPRAQEEEIKPIKVTQNGRTQISLKGSLNQKLTSNGSQTALPKATAGTSYGNSAALADIATVPQGSGVERTTFVSNSNNEHTKKRLLDATVNNSQKIGRASADITKATKRQVQVSNSLENLDFARQKTSLSVTYHENIDSKTDENGLIFQERDKSQTKDPPRSNECVENVLPSSSKFDAFSATTIAQSELSANTSAGNENPYHSDRICKKVNEPSSPAGSKKSREIKVSYQECDDSLKARKNYSRDIVRERVQNISGKKLYEKEKNINERAGASTSQAKRDCDKLRNVRNDNSNAALDLTIKETAAPISAAVDVASELVDSEKQKTVNSDIGRQTPSANALEPNVASFQNKRKNNSSIEASHSNLSLPSENTNLSEASIKPPLSITSSIGPTVPSKPTTIPSNPERRNTRIGSGVLERKTVSEIIGDAQTLTGVGSKLHTKPETEFAKNPSSASRSSPFQTVKSIRSLSPKQDEKKRKKLSNTFFAQNPPRLRYNMPIRAKPDKNSDLLKEDYFMPLFLANASTGKGSIPALDSLLATANKTITTSDAYVPILENQTAKILKRIYSLQSSHKWSLRQPKRSVEPNRPSSHWDVLLQEAAWMRTDFREERKWKRTVAKNMALACAKWVFSDKEQRKLLQIQVKLPMVAQHEDPLFSNGIIRKSVNLAPKPQIDAGLESLVTQGSIEATCINILGTNSPADIFRLRDENVIFGLRRSPTADKLLSELPMYGTPLRVPKPNFWSLDYDPDRFWKRAALPLSKYVESKIRLKLNPPPRKSSRFEYEEDDEEDDKDEEESGAEHGGERNKPSRLPPESTEVALFDSKYRHILERTRNVNCFRPPSEFQMPLQSFFENRTASQWTEDEDRELRILVREYTYNWSLISSILASKSKSILTTGAERRTPWECFERWIEIEGLPSDMQKTHFFRLYSSRMENANRNLANTLSSQNAQGQIQQSRKRSSASVRVERRRNQKHLFLIDTMRKLAKKRETALQKQQHAASLAAMRKAQEVTHVSNKNLSHSTPQDFSRLKHDREEIIKERLLQLQQRQEVQRRAAIAQKNSGVNQQQSGQSNLGRHPANASLASNGSNPANKIHNLSRQTRPHSMLPPMPNHSLSDGLHIPGMGLNTVPQAQMQSQNPLSNPPLDAGLVSRAHAISQHQQAILRQQQQQQHKQQQAHMASHSSQVRNSPTLRMNNLSTPGFPLQGNMISPFPSSSNGVSAPATKQLALPSQAGSAQVAQPPQALTHVQRIEIQYKAKYPTATPEQITSMISQALAQSMQHHQRQSIAQNAINAAAGGSLSGINGASSNQGTPQLFSQMLRHQDLPSKQPTTTNGTNAKPNKKSSSGGGNSGVGHSNRASSGSISNST